MKRGALSAWQLAMLQRQIDELLGRLVHVPSEGPATWAPRCDILDHGDRLVVRLDLPGVQAEDVSVSVADGNLRIAGRKSPPRESSPRHYLSTERSFGPFAIDVPLPTPINEAECRATLLKGVLEIVLPRLPGARAASHQIAVTNEEP
jgi:HSP20 family protein